MGDGWTVCHCPGNGVSVGSRSLFMHKSKQGYRGARRPNVVLVLYMAFRATKQTTSRYPDMDINCPTLCQIDEWCSRYRHAAFTKQSRIRSHFSLFFSSLPDTIQPIHCLTYLGEHL